MRKINNNRMPDVLDCLANLSNDEVFTPPEIANWMLDLLPQEVFMSKETTFLDPFTKSGVFLREITKRLLSYQIMDYETTSAEIDRIEKEAIQNAVINKELNPNDSDYSEKARKIGRKALENNEKASEYLAFEEKLQKELNRILKTQVFGIAITELTAHLTRRSLYCSKDAAGKYSVATDFENTEGNIRFKPRSHAWNKPPKWNADSKKWTGSTCIYCGASSEMFDRPNDMEQHAYEFIHTLKVEELFNMKFDVICGNPPYQISDGTGGNGSSAIPIYHKFIERAIGLNSRYLTMIVPSRWMTGGKGLDKFRKMMLSDTSIRIMHDYADSTLCFPGVSIAGGICYFLRDSEYNGPCECVRHDCNGVTTNKRYMKDANSDIFIRQYELISIKNKVQATQTESFDLIVSAAKPYGLRADTIKSPSKYNLPDMYDKEQKNGYKLIGLGVKNKRVWKYLDKDYPFTHNNMLDKYKLFISKANGAIGTIGEVPETYVIGEPILGLPNQLCTETFLQVGPFETQTEAENAMSYMKTKFFRALVSIKKQSQNMNKSTYEYVPLVDFSKSWTDRELYEMYNLTKDEIAFIEKNIKIMDPVINNWKEDVE